MTEEEKFNTCPNCGSFIKNSNANFCNFCGHLLKNPDKMTLMRVATLEAILRFLDYLSTMDKEFSEKQKIIARLNAQNIAKLNSMFLDLIIFNYSLRNAQPKP